MINKFFTYGTLQTGCSNHGIIDPRAIEKIESATAKSYDLHMHECQVFPCMINGTGEVKGELITIKEEYFEEVLKDLDFLEGYYENNSSASLYHRVLSSYETSEGKEVQAYGYIYNHLIRGGLAQRVWSGDFKEYIQNRGDNYEFTGHVNKN